MRTYTRIIFAALAATLLLSFAVGSASARTGLSASPSETLVVFPELTLESAAGNVICRVTLHVTLHRTIPKTLRTLAGFTTAAVDTCRGGTAGLYRAGTETRATGLQGPYHVQYNGFTGTLPNITEVRLLLVGLRFWITIGGITCNSNNTIAGSTTGGTRVTGLSTNTAGLPLEGGFLCSLASGNLIGVGGVSPTVTVSLL